MKGYIGMDISFERSWQCGDALRLLLHGDVEKVLLLIQATVFASTCKRMSAKALETIVGHWSWCFLLCRGGYSIFSACHMFLEAHKHDADVWHRSWPAVLEELAVAACIGPLLEVDLTETWSTMVRMGEVGYGVVGRESSIEAIRNEIGPPKRRCGGEKCRRR